MAVSPAGKLTWRIPRGVQGKARVEITVTDRMGKTTHQSFQIAFD